MSRTPMTPQRGSELLLDYLDGTLDVDLAQEMTAYLAENAQFRAFVDSYKATIAVVKATMHQEVPKDVEDRTLAVLRTNTTSAKVG